ncbi:MAG: phosphoribosylformylglycinamidine synthase subunit PurL [SAR202 cluster bacterium]|nr:phosphoribosylformylglycinamidine synthase subunit PurL [SAR202 cluster bacterium]
MTASKQELDELALSEAEYATIVERLGREPNALELGLFGSLWSEHCGYKHSKPLLRMLPGDSPRVMVGLGKENAGVVDIGDGFAIVMKIESHNHPSAIEPYQGAATGIGGIVRDIFTMGARPIALLNSLRFGPLSDSHNRHLFGGVVSGISGYGNCIGIPNVGGEILFSPTYSGNPLVNAMCVGIIDKAKLVSATTGGAGNLLMLVGAETGRDGIHGASGLASRAFEESRELRPAVQVGNPFLEKILIEACLEIANTTHIVGLQDLGAAGLTSAAIEAAANGGVGIEVDVAKVPRRESGMSPYEVMLSESQERMLVIVKDGHQDKVQRIFSKWDLQSSVIGRVTDDGAARIINGESCEANLPVSLLTDPPEYRLDGIIPAWQKTAQEYPMGNIPLPTESANSILLQILSSPNIASKEWVYRQYDHHVQTNTVIPPGSDAAVLRIKTTKKGIALSTDGNGRYCYLDPFTGGAIAVAEACRNVSCVGAEPIALTDCLNFGNPEKPEIYYQLEESIKGMTEAAQMLNVPIVSGNVSLYNESHGESIYPTPIIGTLGLLENVKQHVSSGFKKIGDLVVLLGYDNITPKLTTLAGSEYMEIVHNLVVGRPSIKLDLEVSVQQACRRAIKKSLLSSAHDCSDGGLVVAIAESCITGQFGFEASFEPPERWDAALFGEQQSRIIVSLDPQNLSGLEQICGEENVPWRQIGRVSGEGIVVPGVIDISLTQASHAWNRGIHQALSVNATDSP